MNEAWSAYSFQGQDRSAFSSHSGFSNCFPFNFNSSVELEDSDFQIFPNPASDKVLVSSKFEFNSYQIVDLLGNIIQEEQLNPQLTISIFFKHKLNGIYMLILGSERKVQFKKIMISQP